MIDSTTFRVFFIGTAMSIISCQNNSDMYHATRDGGIVSFPNGIKCYKPAREDRTNSPGLTVKVKEIVDLQIKNDQKVEKLIQLSTEGEDIDSQAYRLCEEYGNGITDKETYARQKDIILSWKKAATERGK